MKKLFFTTLMIFLLIFAANSATAAISSHQGDTVVWLDLFPKGQIKIQAIHLSRRGAHVVQVNSQQEFSPTKHGAQPKKKARNEFLVIFTLEEKGRDFLELESTAPLGSLEETIVVRVDEAEHCFYLPEYYLQVKVVVPALPSPPKGGEHFWGFCTYYREYGPGVALYARIAVHEDVARDRGFSFFIEKRHLLPWLYSPWLEISSYWWDDETGDWKVYFLKDIDLSKITFQPSQIHWKLDLTKPTAVRATGRRATTWAATKRR